MENNSRLALEFRYSCLNSISSTLPHLCGFHKVGTLPLSDLCEFSKANPPTSIEISLDTKTCVAVNPWYSCLSLLYFSLKRKSSHFLMHADKKKQKIKTDFLLKRRGKKAKKRKGEINAFPIYRSISTHSQLGNGPVMPAPLAKMTGNRAFCRTAQPVHDRWEIYRCCWQWSHHWPWFLS